MCEVFDCPCGAESDVIHTPRLMACFPIFWFTTFDKSAGFGRRDSRLMSATQISIPYQWTCSCFTLLPTSTAKENFWGTKKYDLFRKAKVRDPTNEKYHYKSLQYQILLLKWSLRLFAFIKLLQDGTRVRREVMVSCSRPSLQRSNMVVHSFQRVCWPSTYTEKVFHFHSIGHIEHAILSIPIIHLELTWSILPVRMILGNVTCGHVGLQPIRVSWDRAGCPTLW